MSTTVCSHVCMECIKSAEPGEDWSSCDVDEVAFVVG
jgi:hypothetical protein